MEQPSSSIEVAAAPAAAGPGRRWRVLAYAHAAVAAAAIAYYVAHIPIQVSDSIGNLLNVQGDSYGRLFMSHLYATGYLRPLLWMQIKGAFDLAGGHYWLMFKGIHALQLLLTALLFVRLLRVRDVAGYAAAALGLAVLFGLHTFNGTVREAFPINSFLTVIVCVLAVANLAISRPRVLNDIAAAVILVGVALTVESGLLVAVAVVAAYVAGLRGISTRGALACVVLAAGYVFLRLGPLATGAPGLLERESGYGFAVLGPQELASRFGDWPYGFYAYNVLASLLGVLFAEPRNGVFEAGRRLAEGGEFPRWLVLNLVTSAAATGLGAVMLARAWHRWRRRAVEDADRLALVALLVIAANAIIGFAYTKDVIQSVAGICLALLVALATADLLRRAARSRLPLQLSVIALLALVSAGWALRAAGLPFLLRQSAFEVRNDWAVVDGFLADQSIPLTTPAARALVEQLRTEALQRPLPHPDIGRPDIADYFDKE